MKAEVILSLERDRHTKELLWYAKVTATYEKYVGTGQTEVEALFNLVEIMAVDL